MKNSKKLTKFELIEDVIKLLLDNKYSVNEIPIYLKAKFSYKFCLEAILENYLKKGEIKC